jgi:F-type H+-transporting ATPase subunit delta
MANETVARRYATAIFSLAKESNAADAVGRDLRESYATISSDDTTRRFFISPVVDRGDKANAIAAAFEPRINEIVLHTLLLLIRKRRETLLGAIVEQYEKLLLAENAREPLEIASARPLEKAELDAIVARLSRKFRRVFDVTQKVDPEILGGVRITMSDRYVDGSIAGRLDELSRLLFAKN